MAAALQMPTIFTHPAVPLAAAPWFRRMPRGLIVVAAICSSLPDVDVLAFRFGIPYGAPFGHRGFTHSLLFAALLAAIAAIPFRATGYKTAFAFLFIAIASHGLLDAMTNGGRGVGFFIPFRNARYFLPWRPIRVSPIGVAFAQRAGVVLRSELLWVWAPAAAIAAAGVWHRHPEPAQRGEGPQGTTS